MPEVTSVKDVANLVNYYEHLVQEWEKWSDDTTASIERAGIVIVEIKD